MDELRNNPQIIELLETLEENGILTNKYGFFDGQSDGLKCVFQAIFNANTLQKCVENCKFI